MNKTLALLAITFGFMCAPAQGQSAVDRPDLSPGDSWSYQRSDVLMKKVTGTYTTEIVAKTEKGYTTNYTGDGDSAGLRSKYISLDLGRIHTEEGKEVDSKWLDFPLTVGKSWKVKDPWHNPQGHQGYDEIPYKVEGIERITVPAGTFDAIKVKGYGDWTNTTTFGAGQVEIVSWYAPEVKNIVRFDRKNWFKGGVLNEWSTELTAFKVEKAGAAISK